MKGVKAELVAPCGMNCALCSAYIAYSHGLQKKTGKIHHCIGCRQRNKQCAFLKVRCKNLSKGKVKFCFECGKMPCKSLAALDLRYRTRYGMSMVENLEFIRKNGIGKFVKKEEKQWRCQKCGKDFICVHNGKCYTCDKVESWKG